MNPYRCLSKFLYVLLVPVSLYAGISAQEFNRRLQKIKQIAAESDGKIEIHVIPESAERLSKPACLPAQTAIAPPIVKNACASMTIGLQLFYAGNYERALLYFIAVCESGSDLDAWYWRGECLDQLHRPLEALQIFSTYLPLASEEKRDDALVRLAMIYYEMGDDIRCRQLMRKVLTLPESDYYPLATKWLSDL